MRPAAPLAALLTAFITTMLVLAPAFAEQSDEVRAQAASESQKLEELVQQMEQQRAEVDDLDRQIDQMAGQSIELQDELIQSRQTLSQIVSQSYKSGGMPTLPELLLSSRNLEDFVANLYYAQKVSEWQADCINQLRESRRDLEDNMAQIEQSLNERSEAIAELDSSRQSIEQNIDALLARAQTLEEEERLAEEARLAEIARQAQLEEQRREEERAKEEAAKQEAERLEAERQEAERQEAERLKAEQEEAARQEAQAQKEAERQREEEERQRQEAEAQSEEPSASESESEDTSSAGSWVTCIASAYTIADNDPPGSTATASGIPLDESVPTVAMPMSMNPARFYGSKIQIEYEGMTIVATITDCGYLSGGARGLDITPAIFRAFGFSTADDWGLRQVRYRFL
ncbi:MAG: hypothetical protein Q4A07_11355 [Coriobacteriales bacterium]|nr:hypothetical protein [Coriobacteriales bacterium]